MRKKKKEDPTLGALGWFWMQGPERRLDVSLHHWMDARAAKLQPMRPSAKYEVFWILNDQPTEQTNTMRLTEILSLVYSIQKGSLMSQNVERSPLLQMWNV